MIAEQHAVIPAMVVAFELEELASPCGRARQPQGNLDDLGSAVGEADPIGAGNNAGQHLRYFVLEIVLSAKCQPFADGVLNGIDDFRGGISKNIGPPAKAVVQIDVAIDVLQA